MSLYLITLLLDGDDRTQVDEVAEELRLQVELEWANGSQVQLVRGPHVLAGEAIDDAVGSP